MRINRVGLSLRGFLETIYRGAWSKLTQYIASKRKSGIVGDFAGADDAIKAELELLQAQIRRPQSSDSAEDSEPDDGAKSSTSLSSDEDDRKWHRISRNVYILARSRAIVAEIRLGYVLTRSGLVAIAVSIFVFGLLLFNFALYVALQMAWGSIWAAIALGVANLMVAAGFAVLAFRVQPRAELTQALSVWDAASDALVSEARVLDAEFKSKTRLLRQPFTWWMWWI